jgi:hypothetical protein
VGVKVRVDRVVVSGLSRAPGPAELRERLAAELRAELRPSAEDPAAAIAAAVARAAGGGRE